MIHIEIQKSKLKTPFVQSIPIFGERRKKRAYDKRTNKNNGLHTRNKNNG